MGEPHVVPGSRLAEEKPDLEGEGVRESCQILQGKGELIGYQFLSVQSFSVIAPSVASAQKRSMEYLDPSHPAHTACSRYVTKGQV